MAFYFLKSTVCFKKVSQSHVIFRYIRGSNRGGEPKLVKGSIKTVTQPDVGKYQMPENFKDFIKTVKDSAFVDDVEIEEALNSGEDFGTAIGSAARPNDKDKFKNKDYKVFVKKKTIGRKYFKFDIESTLLTHAAKEQIRYLHRMDPTDWNPEALSQSFPITVSGVKKLLKSNFVLHSPERIRQHDDEVAERWELLQSRTSSPLVSSYTQRMWNEGKIMKEHYNGNPNLPNTPPVINKTVIHQEKKEIGEFSSIIQQYIEYKKSKESPQNSQSTSEELQVRDASTNSLKNKKHQGKSPNVLNSNRYHVDDETDDKDHITNAFRPFTKRNTNYDTGELLHSQFKENLKEEVTSHKLKPDPRYAEWMKQQSTAEEAKASPKPVDAKELFSKIPKFKKETFELNREGEHVYYYDEKLGYQHPKGKAVKSKIRLPNKSHKKGTVYKVGQAVYDEDGEFLYKVPR